MCRKCSSGPPLRSFSMKLIIIALLITSAGAAQAARIVVNDLGDGPLGPPNGNCNLREAIQAINTFSQVDGCAAGDGFDTIALPAGTINLVGSGLTLVTQNFFNIVTITGQGYLQTMITGNGLNTTENIFTVHNQATLDLQGLTVGAVKSFSKRPLRVDAGAFASLINVRMVNAAPGQQGGCISNDGGVFISHSALTKCKGFFQGGAIANGATGSLTMEFSTVSRGDAEHGGGISNHGFVQIRSSTFGLNHGIAAGAAILNNSTGTVDLRSSTVAFNSTDSTSTGVIHNAGTFNIQGSIVLNNKNKHSSNAGANCSGALMFDFGFNILGTSMADTCSGLSGEGDRFGIRETLTAADSSGELLEGGAVGGTVQLTDSSGNPISTLKVGGIYMPAKTHDSRVSALGKIPVNHESSICFGEDQRNIQRARNSFFCDIGAVERSAALLVVGNTSLSPGDSLVKSRLEGLGYTVTVTSHSSATPSMASNKQLVVISDSVSPTTLQSKFRDVETGVVVLDAGVLPFMNMTNTGGSGTQSGQTRIAIRSEAPAWSWAARGGDFQPSVTVTSSQTYGWGASIDFGDPSELIGTIATNAARHTLFRYPTGQTIAGGFVNPGPRSFFFATANAAAGLNDAGKRLLDRVFLATDTF
jgi:hypothetical protein